MRALRWIELVSCLAGAGVATFQLYHIVFDLSYSYATSTGLHGQQSLFQRAQAGDALSDIQSMSFVAAVFLIALISVIFHSVTGSTLAKRLLWIAAVILIAYSLLGFLTIGLRLLPAALLMLVAALLSLRAPAPASP